jgi:GNAT superfamily N-acetyltransferase
MTTLDRPATLIRRRADPPVWGFGDLRIRRYRRTEFDTVLTLHREGLAQVGLRPGDGIYYEYDLFQMDRLYLSNGGEFLVGELTSNSPHTDRPIVAMGGLRRYSQDDPGIGEMVRLRVRHHVQRRGYGAAMVAALEQRAAELGYRELRADTTEYQTAALELYRGFGWHETTRDSINGITNIYLAKTLA